MARPWLIAQSEGRETELAFEILEGLRTIFCLTGSKDISELRLKKCLLGKNLRAWIEN
jgi:isopentenyl diphosphate isomerase/L-lactate dehydrogenase-like FMN-dependent dehydrogenase